MKSDDYERIQLIADIEALKRDKPPNWKQDVRRKIGRLWHLDRPDFYQASESRGRKSSHTLEHEPSHDDYGESSEP